MCVFLFHLAPVASIKNWDYDQNKYRTNGRESEITFKAKSISVSRRPDFRI